MSVIIMSIVFMGISLLLLLVAAIQEPIRRQFRSEPERQVVARGGSSGNNHLALVPAPPPDQSPRPFDPLEQSSWHKSIREHIRYLARYVHVPPDLDEAGMPEELHRHMQVLAMLQDLFRAGHLHRRATPVQDHDQ